MADELGVRLTRSRRRLSVESGHTSPEVSSPVSTPKKQRGRPKAIAKQNLDNIVENEVVQSPRRVTRNSIVSEAEEQTSPVEAKAAPAKRQTRTKSLLETSLASPRARRVTRRNSVTGSDNEVSTPVTPVRRSRRLSQDVVSLDDSEIIIVKKMTALHNQTLLEENEMEETMEMDKSDRGTKVLENDENTNTKSVNISVSPSMELDKLKKIKVILENCNDRNNQGYDLNLSKDSDKEMSMTKVRKSTTKSETIVDKSRENISSLSDSVSSNILIENIEVEKDAAYDCKAESDINEVIFGTHNVESQSSSAVDKQRNVKHDTPVKLINLNSSTKNSTTLLEISQTRSNNTSKTSDINVTDSINKSKLLLNNTSLSLLNESVLKEKLVNIVPNCDLLLKNNSTCEVNEFSGSRQFQNEENEKENNECILKTSINSIKIMDRETETETNIGEHNTSLMDISNPVEGSLKMEDEKQNTPQQVLSHSKIDLSATKLNDSNNKVKVDATPKLCEASVATLINVSVGDITMKSVDESINNSSSSLNHKSQDNSKISNKLQNSVLEDDVKDIENISLNAKSRGKSSKSYNEIVMDSITNTSDSENNRNCNSYEELSAMTPRNDKRLPKLELFTSTPVPIVKETKFSQKSKRNSNEKMNISANKEERNTRTNIITEEQRNINYTPIKVNENEDNDKQAEIIKNHNDKNSECTSKKADKNSSENSECSDKVDNGKIAIVTDASENDCKGIDSSDGDDDKTEINEKGVKITNSTSDNVIENKGIDDSGSLDNEEAEVLKNSYSRSKNLRADDCKSIDSSDDNETKIDEKCDNESAENSEISDEDEKPDSSNKNQFLNDEATDADDYESGDSLNDDERAEMDENEIVEKGESLNSDDDDLSDDSDYEKDSFIVSSDADEDNLLSGTGDDLSLSDNELNQSAKSKKKFNERKDKERKRASQEMFRARHSLDKNNSGMDETLKSAVKENKKRLRLDSNNEIKKSFSRIKQLSDSEDEISFARLLNSSNTATENEKDPLSQTIIKTELEKSLNKESTFKTNKNHSLENIEKVNVNENASLFVNNESKNPLLSETCDESSSDGHVSQIVGNYNTMLNSLSKTNLGDVTNQEFDSKKEESFSNSQSSKTENSSKLVTSSRDIKSKSFHTSRDINGSLTVSNELSLNKTAPDENIYINLSQVYVNTDDSSDSTRKTVNKNKSLEVVNAEKFQETNSQPVSKRKAKGKGQSVSFRESGVEVELDKDTKKMRNSYNGIEHSHIHIISKKERLLQSLNDQPEEIKRDDKSENPSYTEKESKDVIDKESDIESLKLFYDDNDGQKQNNKSLKSTNYTADSPKSTKKSKKDRKSLDAVEFTTENVNVSNINDKSITSNKKKNRTLESSLLSESQSTKDDNEALKVNKKSRKSINATADKSEISLEHTTENLNVSDVHNNSNTINKMNKKKTLESSFLSLSHNIRDLYDTDGEKHNNKSRKSINDNADTSQISFKNLSKLFNTVNITAESLNVSGVHNKSNTKNKKKKNRTMESSFISETNSIIDVYNDNDEQTPNNKSQKSINDSADSSHISLNVSKNGGKLLDTIDVTAENLNVSDVHNKSNTKNKMNRTLESSLVSESHSIINAYEDNDVQTPRNEKSRKSINDSADRSQIRLKKNKEGKLSDTVDITAENVNASNIQYKSITPNKNMKNRTLESSLVSVSLSITKTESPNIFKKSKKIKLSESEESNTVHRNAVGDCSATEISKTSTFEERSPYNNGDSSSELVCIYKNKDFNQSESPKMSTITSSSNSLQRQESDVDLIHLKRSEAKTSLIQDSTDVPAKGKHRKHRKKRKTMDCDNSPVETCPAVDTASNHSKKNKSSNESTKHALDNHEDTSGVSHKNKKKKTSVSDDSGILLSAVGSCTFAEVVENLLPTKVNCAVSPASKKSEGHVAPASKQKQKKTSKSPSKQPKFADFERMNKKRKAERDLISIEVNKKSKVDERRVKRLPLSFLERLCPSKKSRLVSTTSFKVEKIVTRKATSSCNLNLSIPVDSEPAWTANTGRVNTVKKIIEVKPSEPTPFTSESGCTTEFNIQVLQTKHKQDIRKNSNSIKATNFKDEILFGKSVRRINMDDLMRKSKKIGSTSGNLPFYFGKY